MVDALERLLQLTGLPAGVGLIVLGVLPAAAGAWVRRQWRGHHDAFHRHRALAPGLGGRYGRATRTRRAVLARLRRDLGFDRGRWAVACGLWLLVVVAWSLWSIGLLERVWVRNQLDSELAPLSPGGALLVFALWSAALVYAVRVALDRRARLALDAAPTGAWPALTRAVPLIFVLSGVAAWLANGVGYPLPVALVAVLLPGTGLLTLGIVQDRRVPVPPPAVPGWVLALAPELTPQAHEREAANASSGSLPTVAGPARTTGPRRWAFLGTVPPRDVLRRLAARRRSPGPTVRLPDVSQGPKVRAQAPDPARMRWADLAEPPTPLTGRDPLRLGSYTVVDRIGSGGMAVVFGGRSPSGQRVALKVPSRIEAIDGELRRRMAAEMRAMARLDVQGVVRIRDAEDDDGLVYIAMDYLAGPTLDGAIARLGPIDDPETLRSLAGRLARALAGIHAAGITHRDVKPKNIVFTDAGPVLVDLGIARFADATHRLTDAGVVGSAGYVPPEIHRGQPSGHDVDVWAWAGCIAYAAAGRPLFPGGTVPAIVAGVVEHRPDAEVLRAVDEVDEQVGVVVRLALARDRARRPADGRALWRLLPPFGAWPGPWAVPATLLR